MKSQNPLIVRTEPQPASSIAYRMGNMRDWLDRHKVELAAFRPITLDGMVAFDAQFLDARQAALFRAAFGISAARKAIDEDRDPLSPRLQPLKTALAKLDPASVPKTRVERSPLPAGPARGRGSRRRDGP